MRPARSLLFAILVSPAVFFLQQSGAQAAFHCNRIYAISAGFNGNGNIQFVELRATAANENFVGGHKMKFYDSSNVLKATFTFPSSPANGLNGDSILVATKEFNDVSQGGDADFTFSVGAVGYPPANTVASNGGDAVHPVQSPGGKVVFADQTTFPPDFDCNGGAPPTDSVAYGGATADATFVTQTASLPSPSDNRALRLGTLAAKPSGSATEYALQNADNATFSVVTTDLKSNTSIPRNNGRTVLQLATGVGGIANAPEIGSAALDDSKPAGSRAGVVAAIAAGAAAAAVLATGVGVLVARRRRLE